MQISNYDPNFTYGGTATAGGTVSIDGNGLVTVSGLAANTASTTTITTTQTGYASGSSQNTVTSLNFGPATQLTLTTNAAGATSGSVFTTQPVIILRDAFGNVVTNNNASITITVSGNGTTVGTTTVNAVAGVATFSGVGITGTAGTAYTLTFASNGLTSATQSITPTPTPTVLAVRSTAANGIYGVGDTITLAVQFSEALTLTGSPKLQLETGSNDQFATFTGLGTTAITNDTLTFTYTVQAGDSTPDLDQCSTSALERNEGTLKDAVGNDAILSLAIPGTSGSLAANASLTIHTSIDDSQQSIGATFEASQGPSSLVLKTSLSTQQTDRLGGIIATNTSLFFDKATSDPGSSGGLQASINNPNSTATVKRTSDLISFTVSPTVATSGDVSDLNIKKIRDNAIAKFESVIQEVDLYFPENLVGSDSWNAIYKKNKNDYYYLFNYDPITGLGGMLLDRDNNGNVDGVRLYLKDGKLGDFDETVNGRIDDPVGFATLSTTPTLRISADNKGFTVDGLAGTGLWITLAVSSFSSSSQSNLEMYNNEQPLGAIGATLGSGPTGSQAIYLAAGSTLSFRSSDGSGQTNSNPALSISSTPTGYSLGLDADRNGTYTDLMLDISSALAASSPASLAIARKQLASSDAILDLTSIAATGLTLTLDISTDCGLRNRFGFVKLDPLTGTTYEVAGISQSGGAAFCSAVLSQFIDPYLGTTTSHRYGQSRQTISWALDSSAAGYYAPVMITQGGEVLTFGASTASDGRQHVKLLGTNIFGFEDLLASQGSDWDFNDTKIWVSVA